MITIILCCLLPGAKEPVALELPNQWLWDIIDEFIYQVTPAVLDCE